MFIALAVALVALGVAIAGWFRPTTNESAPPAEPQYSEQEVADAKKALCEAFDKTNRALSGAGGQQSENPAESYAIIVNTRLATTTAADHLFSTVEANPAAPKSLVDSVRDLASSYRDATLRQLAVEPTAQIEPTYAAIDSASNRIKELCQ